MRTIFRDFAKKISVTVRKADGPNKGDPVDLTLATEIKACIAAQEAKLTTTGITIVGDAKLGKFDIDFTAVQLATANIDTGNNQVDGFRWEVERNISSGPLFWWFDYQPGILTQGSCFITPIWVPLAVIGVPTILAWRRDRPFPPGHCQRCGYDLTGNTSGVCPECGVSIDPTKAHNI